MSEPTQNSHLESLLSLKQEEIETDVLVVGGGIAGMFAAIKARDKGVSVTMAVKGAVNRSGCTPFAYGFLTFDKEIHDRQEWSDTNTKNGEYLNNPKSFEALMDHSMDRFKELSEWGITWDRKVFRNVVIKSGVNIVERVTITDLIKDDSGKIAGAVGFPFNEDKLIVFRAKAVVLATGAGGFRPQGFPISCLTSDGEAMAYRIGAEVTGKEFVDLHETSAVTPANGLLYPEDVFSQMNSSRILSFLNLNTNLKAHNGEIPVASAMGPPPGARPDNCPDDKPPRPPSAGEGFTPPDRTVSRGPLGPIGGTPSQPPIESDKSKGMICSASTGLGVHKSEGIWPVGENYSTGIPGLYAAGDCCGSMLGGAKYGQVGCSSSYSSVQGAITGKAAAVYALENKTASLSVSTIEDLKRSVFAARAREKGYSPEWLTQLLQNFMTPYFVTYIKKQDRLEAALTNITFLRENCAPKLRAETTHQLRLAHDIKNMLLNAEWKLRASLFRTESRGVHFREDFPARDDENWLAWVMIKDNSGEMELYKKPIPDEWKPDPGIPYEERYPNRFPGELDCIKSQKIS